MNNEKTLIVSFSGGKTSAFMARFLQMRYGNLGRKILFVFANTGKERPETLDFVNECDKAWDLGVIWLEYDLIKNKSSFKIVSYETASRNGEPFEKMISKYGLPNTTRPHCTRELKQNTVKRWMRSIGLKNGEYEIAIGIRADEAHRINRLRASKNGLIYPLTDEVQASKEFINKWWSRQPFNLRLKDYEGNCDMCWKKSERKLMTLVIEQPKLINWWNSMEIKYGQGYSFFRNGKTSVDLIEMAKNPFRKAVDCTSEKERQVDLFDFSLDFELDCFCKSS